MSPQKLLRTILFISLGAIALVIVAYILKFSRYSISKDPQLWGSFGDYFGGILNPLIGVLNLGVLIYITYQISTAEGTRNENELANQKNFALYSLKHDSLKELNRILEKVAMEVGESSKESELRIILLRNDFDAFITTSSYLFPSFNNKSWVPIKKSIEDLSKISGEYFRSAHLMNIEHDLLPELRNFHNLKVKFIGEVQSQIL
jgi:uncharacterized membrane protein